MIEWVVNINNTHVKQNGQQTLKYFNWRKLIKLHWDHQSLGN